MVGWYIQTNKVTLSTTCNFRVPDKICTDMTGQGRLGQFRTGQDRSRQVEQVGKGQDRTEQVNTGLDRL